MRLTRVANLISVCALVSSFPAFSQTTSYDSTGNCTLAKDGTRWSTNYYSGGGDLRNNDTSKPLVIVCSIPQSNTTGKRIKGAIVAFKNQTGAGTAALCTVNSRFASTTSTISWATSAFGPTDTETTTGGGKVYSSDSGTVKDIALYPANVNASAWLSCTMGKAVSNTSGFFTNGLFGYSVTVF